MKPYQEVPVSVAQSIAENFAKSQVVILCWDDVHELTHCTTFGKSAFEKENAAAVGEKLVQAIGGDLGAKCSFADFHKNYDPAFYKEAIDILLKIRSRQGVALDQLQQIERLLKAAGHGLRQG